MFFTSFKSICNCCKPSKIYGREGAAQVSIKVISSPNKTYVPVRSLCCKSKSSIRYRCEDNCSTFSSLPLLSYCMFLLYAKIEKGRKRKLVFCLLKCCYFVCSLLIDITNSPTMPPTIGSVISPAKLK